MTPLLLLAACMTSAPAPAPGSPPKPAPAPSAEPDEPAGEELKGTTGPTEVPPRGAAGNIALQGVRAAPGKKHERVAFELSEIPGYRVAYVDEAVQCGSGEAVKVPGRAWLEVQLQPAVAHTEEG